MLQGKAAKQILCIPPCQPKDGDDWNHLKAFSANSITPWLRNNIIDPLTYFDSKQGDNTEWMEMWVIVLPQNACLQPQRYKTAIFFVLSSENA